MTIVNEGIRAMFDPTYDPDPIIEKKRRATVKSFSLMNEDIEIIESLRSRLSKRMIHPSESEIIRTAIKSISEMSDEIFLEHYKALKKVPSGRRPKE